MKGRIIIHGNFESPTELVAFLIGKGCELHDIRMWLGPDGRWRGSGEITHALEEAES